MRVTVRQMADYRRTTKRMKRLYWKRHWHFSPRKRQTLKLQKRHKCLRSFVQGTVWKERHYSEVR